MERGKIEHETKRERERERFHMGETTRKLHKEKRESPKREPFREK